MFILPGKYRLLEFQIDHYEGMLKEAVNEDRIKFLKKELKGFYNALNHRS